MQKCYSVPARMLGLSDKGHLAPGEDADLVVANSESHQAVLTVAGGKIIMHDGTVIGKSGSITTTTEGKKHLSVRNIPTRAADLAGSLFYNAPNTHHDG